MIFGALVANNTAVIRTNPMAWFMLDKQVEVELFIFQFATVFVRNINDHKRILLLPGKYHHFNSDTGHCDLLPRTFKRGCLKYQLKSRNPDKLLCSLSPIFVFKNLLQVGPI